MHQSIKAISNKIDCTNRDAEIPKGQYMVYILMHGDAPVVIGHGMRNRAKVIVDKNHGRPTAGHVKAIHVRTYNLFGELPITRFAIPCKNKTEAGNLEKKLHREIGKPSLELPKELSAYLLKDLHPDCQRIIQMAMCSSFSAIDDLYKWRTRELITDIEWSQIERKLNL